MFCLGSLDLSGTRIGDEGLRKLENLTGLYVLNLRGCPLEGDGLSALEENNFLY